MSTLVIRQLHVAIVDSETKKQTEIIKGLDLTINTGETHAIMGPNGTGKSTLSQAIMGHPNYIVTSGDILVDNVSLLAKTVDERARLGLFLAMQYPVEISGITNFEFMRAAMNAQRSPKEQLSIGNFMAELQRNLKMLNMSEAMLERYLNEGFSGGEKKRNEILQMMMLRPKFAILDEIDSGLDIDALQVVAQGVNALAGPKFATLMITHYQRLLDYIKPDYVHIMMDGRIVKTGTGALAQELEQTGYAHLRDELGLDIKLVDED